MVLPYAKEGLNLRDMYNWNKETMLKHLWNLARKNITLKDEILKMNKLNKKKTDRVKLIVGVWTEMNYSLWIQSNKKEVVKGIVVKEMLVTR